MPFIFLRAVASVLERIGWESNHAERCPSCAANIVCGILLIVAVIRLVKILFSKPQNSSH